MPIEGLPFSSIERQVGVYYRRHQPLSQAGARFLALGANRASGIEVRAKTLLLAVECFAPRLGGGCTGLRGREPFA